jgi:hypothetical protein
VGYVEPLCGHAKRYLLSRIRKVYTRKYPSGIEVKVRSENGLAKCVAVT